MFIVHGQTTDFLPIGQDYFLFTVELCISSILLTAFRTSIGSPKPPNAKRLVTIFNQMEDAFRYPKYLALEVIILRQ